MLPVLIIMSIFGDIFYSLLLLALKIDNLKCDCIVLPVPKIMSIFGDIFSFLASYWLLELICMYLNRTCKLTN